VRFEKGSKRQKNTSGRESSRQSHASKLVAACPRENRKTLCRLVMESRKKAGAIRARRGQNDQNARGKKMQESQRFRHNPRKKLIEQWLGHINKKPPKKVQIAGRGHGVATH